MKRFEMLHKNPTGNKNKLQFEDKYQCFCLIFPVQMTGWDMQHCV